MVVDRVSDVITLTAAQVKPAPDTDYLIGSGALNERMLIPVDIEKLAA